MRKSFATPVSNPTSTTSKKQLTVSDLLSVMANKKCLNVKIGAKEYTMVDVAQTPQGALILTQSAHDGKGELLKNVTYDLTRMDGQHLFVEADAEIYEITEINEHGEDLECGVNSSPISFASRRHNVSMFVNTL